MFFANVAFMVGFEDSFVTKLLQLFFKHSEIVHSALITTLKHLDTVRFKDWDHLRLNPVNHVLRMKPRTVVELERLA